MPAGLFRVARFACPLCGVESPPAASFCGWCRHPLLADPDLPALQRDPAGRHDVQPAGGLPDCPDPWAWGGDGRSLYLFEGVERGGKLAVRPVPTQGEPPSPPVPLLPADAVRGLAVTRRGAFAASASTVRGVLAARTPGGEARAVEAAFPGAEIVGFAGAGDRLFVAALEGGRLTLRAGAAVADLPVVAACPWPGAAPSWLRLYVEADGGAVLLWGAGCVGRADLDLGVLTLGAHPDAPVSEALEMARRRSDAAAAPLCPAGCRGVAIAPAEGGGWGLLDLATASLAKPPADCASPLAVAAAGRGAVALRPGFLAHLELAGGALQERRIPIGPSSSAALSAGPDGALALISRPDGSLVVAEAKLAPGRPPSAWEETELRLTGAGVDAFSMLPPQRIGERLWFAGLGGEQVLLWTGVPEGAA